MLFENGFDITHGINTFHKKHCVRSSAWTCPRKQVTVDLFPERTDRVEAMENLSFSSFRYYIVAWDEDRPVPVNTQGSGAGIDVAIFGSRFVSAYSAKI